MKRILSLTVVIMSVTILYLIYQLIQPVTGSSSIVLKSLYQGYRLVPADMTQLNKHLKNIGFWQPNKIANPSSEFKRETAKRLLLVLTDVPQNYDRSIDSKKNLLSSWGVQVTDSEVSIFVYENISLLKSYGLDIDGSFNLTILRSTYLLTQLNTNFKDPELLRLQSLFMKSPQVFINLKEQVSLFEKILNIIIPQARAAGGTCGGSGVCGHWINECYCEGNSHSCRVNSDCIAYGGGACDCLQSYCSGEFAANCSQWSSSTSDNSNQCNNGPCGWGLCIDGGSCSWNNTPNPTSPPGPTSTPGPTPTSPPGPTPTPGGSGGNCGASCTDSSQCSSGLSCAPEIRYPTVRL